MSKRNVVIAGGGTGGHIYPGLALAEHLKKTDPNIQVHFVGAEGGLEEKIIPKYDYPLHLLKMDRLHSSAGIKKRLRTLFLLPFAIFRSVSLYKELDPLWVLGVGGFASGPFVLTASLMGGKTALLEPNAYPGLANRWLSKFVKFCFLVFDDASSFFPKEKIQSVGLPVRMKKQGPGENYDGSRSFRILIFGGSQGARAINQAFGDWVENMGAEASAYEILHQVGKRDYDSWQSRYGQNYQGNLEYCEYIHDMPEKLKWADLVVCRAGVGTVAEVAMSCRPAIFIPLPTAADNHQQKNAEVLVHLGGARMLLQQNLSWQSLQSAVEKLRAQPELLIKMKTQLLGIDYSKAQEQILDVLMKEDL